MCLTIPRITEAAQGSVINDCLWCTNPSDYLWNDQIWGIKFCKHEERTQNTAYRYKLQPHFPGFPSHPRKPYKIHSEIEVPSNHSLGVSEVTGSFNFPKSIIFKPHRVKKSFYLVIACTLLICLSLSKQLVRILLYHLIRYKCCITFWECFSILKRSILLTN